MIQGFIFDLDGTLLDTLESIAAAFNRSLEALGYPGHATDAFRYFIGDGARQCAIRCLPADERQEENIARLLDTWRDDYGSHWHELAQPYPGIVELLTTLNARSVPIAALSNKDDKFSKQCVDFFLPSIAFTAVQGFSASVPHKPDPAGAQLVAASMKLSHETLALVGDTAVDMNTAHACNMQAVGVLWGFREANELSAAGAQFIIEHPLDLLKFIDE